VPKRSASTPSGALASRPIAPAIVIPIPTCAGDSLTERVRNRAQQVYQAPLPQLVISVAQGEAADRCLLGRRHRQPWQPGIPRDRSHAARLPTLSGPVDHLANSYNLRVRVRVDLTAEDLAATHFSMSPLFETIEDPGG